jgi:predicted nicotinamide N-methyase
MYKTEIIEVELQRLTVELLQITNVDELFDALLARAADDVQVQDEQIPYWAELWPSAIVMSEYLLRNNLISHGLNVLEIGCGLGLPGIVAGKLGATVTMTDYLQEAIDFAQKNWDLNNNKPATFRTLDWRTPDATLAADLLLASDVAYEARLYKHLPHAFRMLCKPNGKIILAEPNRLFAADFLDSLSQQGFFIRKEIQHFEFRGQSNVINILEITL